MESGYFTMDFPADVIRQTVLLKDEEALAKIKATSPEKETLPKVKDIYGEVYFPPAPSDRPYTFASIVVSVDGKIAFMDDQQGPLVSSKNALDPDGGFSDFWVLNMLRSYADAVVVGAKTMAMEETMTANCFDKELAEARVPVMGKSATCPAHVVVSFDGTDIPLEHCVFDLDATVIIATSPKGQGYVRENMKKPIVELGPYATKEAINMAEVNEKLKANPGAVIVVATGEQDKTDGEVLLALLRAIGYERLLVESPSYMTYLMSIGAMDEMFINYSTVYVGGSVGFGAFQHFTTQNHPHAEFLQINVHKQNFLYTRQRLVYGVQPK